VVPNALAGWSVFRKGRGAYCRSGVQNAALRAAPHCPAGAFVASLPRQA